MIIPIFQGDAFTSSLYGGNPAAVCHLEDWLDASIMQKIATENNFSETAFIVGANGNYDLRWFTPAVEVDLCGHATLATAYYVFTYVEPGAGEICFKTMSGELRVTRDGDQFSMLFPARPPVPCELPPQMSDAMGASPVAAYIARDLMLLFESEQQVRALAPDFVKLTQIEAGMATIVTAPGEEADFVSRFFAPKAGIAEDPVTGSAHCTLVPFWSERLGKPKLFARQLSARGGEIYCDDLGEKVRLTGQVVEFLRGHINI